MTPTRSRRKRKEFALKSVAATLLATALAVTGLMIQPTSAEAHQWGCYSWPHTSGLLYLQHYVGTVDFVAYPEYRDAINDWNQTTTPIVFYDGGTTNSYQVKSVTASYTDSWPGYAIVYGGCSISSAAVLLNTRLMDTYSTPSRRHVECQELGHALGLDHNTVIPSCMNDNTYYQYYIAQHDLDDIIAMYPR